jgi:hypothetical protein
VRDLARFKRRVFHIRIPKSASGDVEKFLERLSEAIKSYGGAIRLEDNESVRVEIYGDGSMIRDSWIRIRNLLKEYRSLEVGRGLKGYSLKRIYKEVGLAVPSDVLVEALRVKGYKAESDGENIISDADLDTIISLASEIKRAIEDLRFVQATRTAKKLIAAVSATTGRPVDDVIEKGIETGFLSEEETSGKISVISPWREVIRELVRVLEGEQPT